jgi:hypothetical protein
MHVPSAEELAAIAVAWRSMQPEPPPPATPVSRWRLAARALAPAPRGPWRDASRLP